ncbi:MAG: hypothetical protein Q4F24_08105 [Eubacteriales bacterium]|nr:hypothetical protein [Eubacteriales bacterium]
MTENASKVEPVDIGEEKNELTGEVRIYVGPPIRGVAVGTVFKNGLTPAMENAISKKPILKGLLVPVSRIQEVRRSLDTAGSALNRIYKEAEK